MAPLASLKTTQDQWVSKLKNEAPTTVRLLLPMTGKRSKIMTKIGKNGLDTREAANKLKNLLNISIKLLKQPSKTSLLDKSRLLGILLKWFTLFLNMPNQEVNATPKH